MQYLFGRTDLAARRLKAVAEVFAESTRPFRLEAKAGCPPVSLDMVVLAGIINLRGDCRSDSGGSAGKFKGTAGRPNSHGE